MSRSTTLKISALALAALLGPLAGCGGDPTTLGADAEPAAARARPAAQVTPPLLADDGSAYPSDPANVPADPGARTRAGLYASEAQAAMLENALGAGAIRTDTDTATDAMPAADLAVMMAYGQLDAHGLGSDAPVLVRGRDQRLAAAAANRLSEQGFTRVFLVTR